MADSYSKKVREQATTLSSRIDHVAEVAGGKRALANMIGVHETQLYRYIRGENAPSIDIAAKIAEAGKVSIQWLATGEEVASKEPEPSDFVYVPVYDIRASAGSGAFVQSEDVIDMLAFKEKWVRQVVQAQPSDLAIIRVHGESMYPTLRPGDTVLINMKERDARQDGIYVVRMGDSLLVKRVQHIPSGKLRISSDNPSFEAFLIEASEEQPDFDIIGRVTWVGRLV